MTTRTGWSEKMSVKPIVIAEDHKLPAIRFHESDGIEGELEFTTAEEVVDTALSLLEHTVKLNLHERCSFDKRIKFLYNMSFGNS